MKLLASAGLALLIGVSGAMAQTRTTETTTTTVTTEQVGKVREYVMKERKPSVKISESVAVGAALPQNVTVYELPTTVGVSGSYAIVNDKTVLVGPDRKVIRVIE
ncbi:MAG: hypothetical protein JWN93_2805 [Hyphomicrobiales bacterium]|jgi:hypothetical protein|nr:hypothetical protein [Hyphomicrobiales bacterium]